MKYLYNPPYLVKKLFSSFQWESVNNKILITFDDGPIPQTTPVILKKLNELGLKSVFFCVGENVQKYPELTGEILAEGHIIGNHTYNHTKLNTLSREETVEQINLFNSLLLKKFNYSIKYFRAPHGRFNLATPGILKNKKLLNVMWSLLTYDFKNDLNIVKFTVDKYLRSNSIVVLHDSLKSKDIINDSIQYLLDSGDKKGFQTGKPVECLKQSF